MKSKMSDVRDFLVQALEDLSDLDADPDKMARTIERSKAISTVAGTYVQTVKVEIDARRLAEEIGAMPTAFETPKALPRHDEPSGNVARLPGRVRR